MRAGFKVELASASGGSTGKGIYMVSCEDMKDGYRAAVNAYHAAVRAEAGAEDIERLYAAIFAFLVEHREGGAE